MAILPNFEYDIFISYRHNDNRSSWVTEFVKALQEELAATIKEPVSLYFDSNPHDGLLETHNVDKSLQGKLKCLIFIPILSQTYCDPKSFAWQHEFCAFNKLAKEDQFGRDVKLSNGNVASRILPIKIHDLDAEDKSIIENEIGGVLRAIEFIFKSAGVNRSLRAVEEHPQDNLNKTFYRDQINKVANAIKEIIGAFKNSGSEKPTATYYLPKTKHSKSKPKFIVVASVTLVLLLVGYFLYLKFSSYSNRSEINSKSIAVLPFTSMNATDSLDYLGDAIADQIITRLSQIKELRVIGRSSSFKFRGNQIDFTKLSEQLNVSTVLEGSVMKSGNQIRVTARLTRLNDESVIWVEEFNNELTELFTVQDEISGGIARKLKIELLPNLRPNQSTQNPEAVENLLKANYFINQPELADLHYKKTFQIDSNYVDAYNSYALYQLFLAFNSTDSLRFLHVHEIHKTVRKAIALGDSINYHESLFHLNAWIDWNWADAEVEYQKYIQGKRDIPSSTETLSNLSIPSHLLIRAFVYGELDKSIAQLEKIRLNNPLDGSFPRFLSWLYREKGNYAEAKKFATECIELTSPYSDFTTLAKVEFLEKDFENCIKHCKAAIDIDSSDWIAKAFLVHALIKTGKAKEAEKIVYESTKTPITFFGRAIMSFSINNRDEGFRMLELAREYHDPRLIYIRSTLVPIEMEIQNDKRFKEFIAKFNFPSSN